MVCLDDFERYASKVLPKYAYDYYRSGADDQITLKENAEAFRRFVHVHVHCANYKRIDFELRLLWPKILSYAAGAAGLVRADSAYRAV